MSASHDAARRNDDFRAMRMEVALAERLRKHEGFHSAFLNRDRDVTVYLPPGYDAEEVLPIVQIEDGIAQPFFGVVAGRQVHGHVAIPVEKSGVKTFVLTQALG